MADFKKKGMSGGSIIRRVVWYRGWRIIIVLELYKITVDGRTAKHVRVVTRALDDPKLYSIVVTNHCAYGNGFCCAVWIAP